MRIEIITLIDVTLTNEKRDGDQKKFKQQSNYNTLIQCASLRTNLVPIALERKNGSIGKLNFGSLYKNKQNYWIATFDTERESFIISKEMLCDDFNLVPILSGLDETIQLEQSIFRTDTQFKNVTFKINKV